jgi:hypothetical protein
MTTTTTPQHAPCGFSWCDQDTCHEGDHWGVIYHDATETYGEPSPLKDGQTPFRIGIGTKYEEGQLPTVVMHLDGGESDYDCEAFLRVEEAVEIRDALTKAIEDARDVLYDCTNCSDTGRVRLTTGTFNYTESCIACRAEELATSEVDGVKR